MKTILRIAVVAIVLFISSLAEAQVGLSFGLQFGNPPPPRREIVCPRPYPEAYWVPGYWNYSYRAHRYLWVPGRWDRRLACYEPAPRPRPRFVPEYREHRRRW